MQHQDDKQPPARALRFTSRTPGEKPDPVDGPFAIERMTTLAHELANLLDGSMRCLGLARRSLAVARGGTAQTEAGLRQLDTVHEALERMADLVHAAMKGSASIVGSPTMNPKQPITIVEAAAHAIDVLTPEADDAGVGIELRASDEARRTPAGPLYSVVLNGLRNALESIALAERGRGGHIGVDLGVQPIPGTEVDLLIIEITDDGRGLSSSGQGMKAFDFGFTTKPGGLGVGLALAREVVREVGGNIELNQRPERAGNPRPGAVLKIVYPLVRSRR